MSAAIAAAAQAAFAVLFKMIPRFKVERPTRSGSFHRVSLAAAADFDREQALPHRCGPAQARYFFISGNFSVNITPLYYVKGRHGQCLRRRFWHVKFHSGLGTTGTANHAGARGR
jgi:hypothetical protein